MEQEPEIPLSETELIEKYVEEPPKESSPQSAYSSSELVSYLNRCWEEAKRAKEDNAEEQILKNMRQISGQYEADKLNAIKSINGPEIFMQITDAKAKNASHWVEDILFQPGSRPWGIMPTPIPDLPDSVKAEMVNDLMTTIVDAAMQEAMATGIEPDQEYIQQQIESAMPKVEDILYGTILDRAKALGEKIETKVDDSLTEGEWYAALRKCIPNIIMHTGFMKGPVTKKRKMQRTVQDESGKISTVVSEDLIDTYESIHPIYMYPSPDSTGINDGYLIERSSISPIKLQELIGVEGYNSEEIMAVLDSCEHRGNGRWLEDVDQDKSDIDGAPSTLMYGSDKIDLLIFWGYAKGEDLIRWGIENNIDETPLNPVLYYNINAYWIDSNLIKAVLNSHPLGHRPYYKCSFEEIDGSFWGRGLPQIIEDVQSICNACARAIVLNVAMACLTGDTVVHRYRAGKHYTSLTLNELWERKSKSRSGKTRKLSLRAMDEKTGTLVQSRLLDILDNGIRPVYQIVTKKGYKIKATGKHRFVRDTGEWQVLDDFNAGDLIAVNGQVSALSATCMDCGKLTKGKGIRCKSCAGSFSQTYPGQLPKICTECGEPTARRGVRCRKCASALHNSKWNQQQVANARENRDTNKTTARARIECQVNKKNFCEECGSTNKRIELHHIDRDPWNNIPSNLKTFCVNCHHTLHEKEDTFGNPYLHRFITYDQISSIEYIGEERVFDLCMETPNHNFIANGFVSHNSGPQVERNIDRIPSYAREDNRLVPWKVWDTTSDMMSQGAAINFYQPPMVVERLMNIYNKFSKIADEHSGVPGYAHGDPNVGGGGSTATGLSLLMGGAARGIRAIVQSIDNSIIKPSVSTQYYKLISSEENYGLIADYQIVSIGSSAALVKEQLAARRLEFLRMTSNPIDLNIIGAEGRKYLLQEIAKSIQLDLSRVFPATPPQLPQPEQGNEPPGPQKLDQAGNPVVGQDTRQFNQGPSAALNP